MSCKGLKQEYIYNTWMFKKFWPKTLIIMVMRINTKKTWVINNHLFTALRQLNIRYFTLLYFYIGKYPGNIYN